MLRETFLTPRELQIYTGQPVLATIPLQRMRYGGSVFEVSERAGQDELGYGDEEIEIPETFTPTTTYGIPAGEWLYHED